MRIDWKTVLAIAKRHVNDETSLYDVPPTLRRCHYLLVADAEARAAGYVNSLGCYKALSERTGKLRDAGTFPPFTDRGRSIERADGYQDIGQLLRIDAHWFRLDRSRHLPVKVVLLVEKDGVVPLLRSRFGWLDVSATKGYASITHTNTLASMKDRKRETVGIYLGDYDPSGLDITRKLAERLPYRLRRIGLSLEQVIEHELRPMVAKAGDSRIAAMIAAEGEAMQVELDAMPAEVLLNLVAATITEETGVEIRDDGMPDLPDVDVSEAEQRAELLELAERWSA